MDKKRILITGGTGMIGRALARELTGTGYDVIALARHTSTAGAGTLQTQEWDGRTAQGWGQLADGAAAIVNLAGESIAPIPWWVNGRKQRLLDSRVNAGRAVTEAVQAARVKPQALVQMSAIGYYGLHGNEAVTENDPAGGDYLSQVCEAWERATAPVEALGVRRAILRTAVVLSERGGLIPYMSLPFKLFVGGPLGSGKQWFPWIHIRDLAAAFRFAIENPNASGALNVTTPNPTTNAEFGRALGRVLGRPYWFPTPAFALRLAFGEMADLLLLGGQRALPKRLQEMGLQFQFGDVESALRDLNKK